jgi:hypothetical protein
MAAQFHLIDHLLRARALHSPTTQHLSHTRTYLDMQIPMCLFQSCLDLETAGLSATASTLELATLYTTRN